MTPVIKAFCTDVGFEITNLALQCFGGHGYIREYGMEQFVRDARIAQIYEGTNGVQAMDLLGAKGARGTTAAWCGDSLRSCERDLSAMAEQPALRSDRAARARRAARCSDGSPGRRWRARRSNPDEIGAAAAEYLRLFGLVATGWMWARMAAIGESKAGVRRRRRVEALARRSSTSRSCCPRHTSLAARIDAGAAPVMALDAAAF